MLAQVQYALYIYTFCGISVKTSAIGVQYCTGSHLSVAPVYQLGKQLDEDSTVWHLH